MKKKLLAILLVLIIVSCGTTAMMMTVTRPAEVNLKQYNKIAVGDIVDEYGKEDRHAKDIADEITTSLFASGKYEVLDRQNLNSIMTEHKLSLSGLIDENTASELGKIIGAAALVFGRIQTDNYDEETSKADPWVDKKGKRHQSQYRKGTYTLSVNLKIVDIMTAKILAVKSLSSSYYSSLSKDNGWPAEIDAGYLYTKCIIKITQDFMHLVAPYDVQVKAKFQTDKKLPEIDQAINQLKIGEWEEAIGLFISATEKDGIDAKIKAKAFYDLGLAQMYAGDFDDSIENFKEAFKLTNSKLYMNAINEAKAEKEKAEKLKEQQG